MSKCVYHFGAVSFYLNNMRPAKIKNNDYCATIRQCAATDELN